MEEICKEFDVKDCNWKELRKKIVEFLESYAMVLEGALQPSTLADLHEANYVNKINLERTHRKLMFHSRSGIEEGLKGNDEVFVKVFWSEWSLIKNDLILVFNNMKTAWKEQRKEEIDFAYLG